MKTFIRKRIKSFGYAFRGIASFVCKEPHAWIHCTATVVVTLLGFYCGISSMEWCVVLLCIGMVLAAEAFNTAIERFVDLVSPDYHPLAGEVKDIAAGAVLMVAIVAAVIGGIVFIPYFI